MANFPHKNVRKINANFMSKWQTFLNNKKCVIDFFVKGHPSIYIDFPSEFLNGS